MLIESQFDGAGPLRCEGSIRRRRRPMLDIREDWQSRSKCFSHCSERDLQVAWMECYQSAQWW